MRFQPVEVEQGVRGVLELLARKGMLASRTRHAQRQEIYYRARWVRVDDGGILLASVALGDAVKTGDELGSVTDPISSQRTIVRSPYDGRVIGMALNQVVIPGFAAFHIGVEQPVPDGVEPEPEPEEPAPPSPRPDQLDPEEAPE